MSNFENREILEGVIESRRSIEGRELSDNELAAAQILLDHPKFDTMSLDGRRALYQSQLAHRSGIDSREPSDSMSATADTMSVIGWLLLAVGATVTIVSFFLRTSVTSTTGGDMIGDTYIPQTTSSVINIGMLQNQLMVFQTGLVLVIGGLLLISAATIRSTLVQMNTPTPSDD